MRNTANRRSAKKIKQNQIKPFPQGHNPMDVLTNSQKPRPTTGLPFGFNPNESNGQSLFQAELGIVKYAKPSATEPPKYRGRPRLKETVVTKFDKEEFTEADAEAFAEELMPDKAFREYVMACYTREDHKLKMAYYHYRVNQQGATLEEARSNIYEHMQKYERMMTVVTEGMSEMDFSEEAIAKGNAILREHYSGFQGWRMDLLDVLGPAILAKLELATKKDVKAFTKNVNNWFCPIDTWQSYGTEGIKGGLFDILKDCMPDTMNNRGGADYLSLKTDKLLPKTLTSAPADNDDFHVVTFSEREEMRKAKADQQSEDEVQASELTGEPLEQFIKERAKAKKQLAEEMKMQQLFEEEARNCQRERDQADEAAKQLALALEAEVAKSDAANRKMTENLEEARKLQNNRKPQEELVAQYDRRYEEAVSVVKKVS